MRKTVEYSMGGSSSVSFLFRFLGTFLLAGGAWFAAGCGGPDVAGAEGAGTGYFVAPDGDDANPGTREEPWRTPEHAGRSAQAGDTVLFLPGDYSGRLVPPNSGPAEAPSGVGRAWSGPPTARRSTARHTGFSSAMSPTWRSKGSTSRIPAPAGG